jgi:hypothetical protein
MRDVGPDPKAATVRLDDRAAYVQSQAHPVWLGGKRGMKQAVRVLRIESYPRVLDGYRHMSHVEALRRDPKVAATVP